ncbi:MAG: M48 family metallopeptidase [Bacillota bacterium]
MSIQEFHDLVDRLTVRSEKHPKKYKFQVFSLALLGYFYIYFILLILLSLIGLTVWGIIGGHLFSLLIKLGLAIVALGYIIVKSLWVRFEPPNGIEVSPKKAPELYKKIEEIRKKLGSPTIHHILLVDEWNASIVQNPRLGPFGWYKNYLVIGVPLMQGLTEEDFHFVIAHELGHLSNSHGRFGTWIYRTRKSWSRILERLENEKHWSTFLFKPFFRRYFPRFDAYSFVMARAQEFEADEYGARVAGSNHAGTALIQLSVTGLFLYREFWPSIYSLASEQSHPPKDVYFQLKNALRSPIAKDKIEGWLNESLSEETSWEDTHPSLKERLDNLQMNENLPPLTLITAASDIYLHSIEDVMMTAFSEDWREHEKAEWKERYQYVLQSKQTLSDLETRAFTENLSLDEQWEQAVLTEELLSEDKALPLFQKIADVDGLPEAHFAAGRILIAKNEASGAHYLTKAMELDRHIIIPASKILARFYYENDMEEQFDHYYSIFMNESEFKEIFEFERSAVRDEDRFTDHSLPEDIVQEIKSKLQIFPEIVEAQLVQKELQAYPDEPCFVLALKINKPAKIKWNEDASKKFESQLIDRISTEISMPAQTLFYIRKWEEVIINGNLKKVSDSIIYTKAS